VQDVGRSPTDVGLFSFGDSYRDLCRGVRIAEL